MRINGSTDKNKTILKIKWQDLQFVNLKSRPWEPVFFFLLFLSKGGCRTNKVFVLFAESFNSEGHDISWKKHKHDELLAKNNRIWIDGFLPIFCMCRLISNVSYNNKMGKMSILYKNHIGDIIHVIRTWKALQYCDDILQCAFFAF